MGSHHSPYLMSGSAPAILSTTRATRAMAGVLQNLLLSPILYFTATIIAVIIMPLQLSVPPKLTARSAHVTGRHTEWPKLRDRHHTHKVPRPQEHISLPPLLLG